MAKQTAMAGKWMVAAAMVMSAACAGAGDELGAGSQDLSAVSRPAANGKGSGIRRDVTTRIPAGAQLPLKPEAAGSQCGDQAASALVQTAVGAMVQVPTAIGWRYYLDQTPVLRIAAFVKNLCGGHMGRFDIYSPDGRLFKRQLKTFVAEPNGQNVRKEGDGYVIETELTIAGTEIAGLPMTGVWSVNFAVDGQDRALGLGLFELYR